MTELENFLYVYFYQLEDALNKDSKGLANLKFQSEEANTDEEVKIFFKDYIQKNPIIKSGAINELVIDTDGIKNSVDVTLLQKFSISKVLLPSDLTDEMKTKIAASKKSVYTNPDLYLEISDGDKNISYVSIELKTTKTNQIPGSSVQQVSPFEWVIFVKHTDDGKVEVSCGFYINSITERLPFPDRSPRPIIAFDTLKKWNNKHRTITDGVLEYSINKSEQVNKEKILNNWEKVLCKEWLETITKDVTKSEKWFNNTIRMYTLYLLCNIKEKPELLDKLIKKLKNNVKDK